ncbi:alpha/beta fold hydrolase [Gloeothece verrucosa]|uniref:Alpha/beta hydrolase fold protein n=1 Tax=Gloeothece verrucosa (strain PCC 7822) TaxID=497965 RepID=E0UEG5_GLOV7|nr:alpha/beta hydrolase [Gloeothece verrucosa]ADN15411.1 alpha/beta hydrolase fold protein [Gloeothece verrucosa PCC 7822]
MKEDLLSGQLISLRRGLSLQVSHQKGNTPALVFIHGGLGNRYNLRCQYEFFAQKGQQVLAYDLAGHGQSTPYPRYSIGRHQRDLTRLLNHFQIKSPILCCHSYGVPIGLEWAKNHQASALILIAGGTHDLAPWWEIPLMKFLAWGGRYFYHFKLIQQLTNRLSSPQMTEILERFLNECPVPTNFEPYKALEIFWGYNFFARYNSPIEFQIPVLVISGGQDSMFTQSMGEELASHFTQGQQLHLPQAGHLVIAEYPEIVNEAICNFLNKLNNN